MNWTLYLGVNKLLSRFKDQGELKECFHPCARGQEGLSKVGVSLFFSRLIVTRYIDQSSVSQQGCCGKVADK